LVGSKWRTRLEDDDYLTNLSPACFESAEDLEDMIDAQATSVWTSMNEAHLSPRHPQQPPEIERYALESLVVSLKEAMAHIPDRKPHDCIVDLFEKVESRMGWREVLNSWEIHHKVTWGCASPRPSPVSDPNRLEKPKPGQGQIHKRVKRSMDWKLMYSLDMCRVRGPEGSPWLFSSPNHKPCSAIVVCALPWDKVLLFCRHPKGVNWSLLPERLKMGSWKMLSTGLWVHHPP